MAFPTDTVYGLGGDPWREEVVRRIYEIKSRKPSAPLPVLVKDVRQLMELVREISPLAWKLIRAFLPGPLTLVLPRAPHIPDFLTGGRDLIGVRIPNHPVPLALMELSGRPLVGTSANISGGPSLSDFEDVRRELEGKVDLIIPGECPGKTPSTVVEVRGDELIVLRRGMIEEEEIRRVAGR